jgi:hypothetical protein
MKRQLELVLRSEIVHQSPVVWSAASLRRYPLICYTWVPCVRAPTSNDEIYGETYVIFDLWDIYNIYDFLLRICFVSINNTMVRRNDIHDWSRLHTSIKRFVDSQIDSSCLWVIWAVYLAIYAVNPKNLPIAAVCTCPCKIEMVWMLLMEWLDYTVRYSGLNYAHSIAYLYLTAMGHDLQALKLTFGCRH